MELCNAGWPWFAIHIKRCTENAAANALQYKGYECFLPLSKSTRSWSDRTKQWEGPLFPGYLFCRFDPHNRLPILQSPGVMKILGMGKMLIPVEAEEIAAMQLVGERGLPARPWPFLDVGQKVRIKNGPLRGLSGIVVAVRSESKLVLSVTLLRRSVAVEIEGGWLVDLHSGKSDDLLNGSHDSIRQDEAGPSPGLQPGWYDSTSAKWMN